MIFWSVATAAQIRRWRLASPQTVFAALALAFGLFVSAPAQAQSASSLDGNLTVSLSKQTFSPQEDMSSAITITVIGDYQIVEIYIDGNYQGSNLAYYPGSTTVTQAASSAGQIKAPASNGTHTISVNGDLSGSTGTVTFQVASTQSPQTITFANPGSKTFGTTPTLSATASSNLAVSFTSATTSVCTITTGGALTFVAAGSCTINADQTGNASYSAATRVSQTFTVAQASQTITFANPGTLSSGTTLSASASSGLAVAFTSATPSICTITTGGALTIVAAGSCTINADQNGNGNYSAATRVSQTFTVSALSPQTITFVNPGTQTFGTTPTLSATASSGLAVAFTSATTSICTITTGGALTFVAAGSCIINADQAGNASYSAATRVSQTFTVAQAGQTITFANPGTLSAGTTLAASASSGLAVAFTSSTPLICTITTGGALTIVAGGSCIINADQNGNGNYSAATRVSQTFTVTALSSQTITFVNPGTQTFGTTPTLSATASSGLAVSFASATTSVCTITPGGALTFVSAGSCMINADQAGNATYSAATRVSQTFSVSQAGQTITFANPGTLSAGTTLPASASSGLAVAFTSATPSICTITTGGALTIVAAGSCIINADQNGNGNYSAATRVSQTFTVTALSPQTITFANPGTQTFGTTPTLSATASSNLAVSFTSATTSVCTITTGGALTFVAAGSCTINADQTGNASYSAATRVSQTFTVAQASQTITFANPGTLSSGTTLSASASSGLAVAFTSATASICTITTGGALTIVAAGSCTINADQNGNGNYSAATRVSQTFTVTALSSQTITFANPGTQTFGTTPTLSATASSGLAVAFTSATTSICTITTGGALTFITAGSCTINADQSGNATYSAAARVSQTFAVSSSAQVITFNAPTGAAVGGSATLVATATSNLPVVFGTTSPAICSVSGTTVTYLAVGSCVITADQAGNGAWGAATQVTRTVVVGLAATATALTVDNPPAGPVVLTAVVTRVAGSAPLSGSVTFTDGAVTLATVILSNGGATFTISALSAGSHSIVAAYSGDANYAPSASTAVTIAPARTDPTANAKTRAVTTSHVQTVQRIAARQIDMVNRRIERLHEEDTEGFVNGVALIAPSAVSAYSPADPLSPMGARERPGAIAALDRNAGRGPIKQQGLGPDYYVWTAGALVFGRDKIEGRPDTTHSVSQAVTVGVDTKLMQGLRAGVAFSGFLSTARLDDVGSRDRSRAWTGSLYTSWAVAPGVFLDGLLGFGAARYRSSRFDDGAASLLTGSRDANLLFGSVTASWDQKSGPWTYAPYARFDFSQSWLDKYVEKGLEAYALAFDKATVPSQSVVLGLRGQYDIAYGDGFVSPTLRVEYRRVLNGDATQAMNYVADPATTYNLTVVGARRDVVTGSLGVRAIGDGAISGQLEYSASLAMQGGGFAGQGLRGTIRLGF